MTKNSRGRVVTAVLAALMLVVLLTGIAGCQGEAGATGATGPTGPQGPQGEPGEDATVACQACHDDRGTVSAKEVQWAESGHGEAEAWAYAGGRDNCTSCHSGTGFMDWTAAGGATSATVADPNNTPIDCRACHEIHTTYTGADFTLRTTDPVEMIIDSSLVYDAGKSNLCANCHQSRTASGATSVTSTHYGAHHGPQASMILSSGGYGVDLSPAPHYSQIANGCVSCHMVEANHTFTVNLAACEGCHADPEGNIEEAQAEIKDLLSDLAELLEAKGALHEEDGAWHPVVGEWGEVVTGAVYNFMFVTEDSSFGVHNYFYAKSLLEWSIADLS